MDIHDIALSLYTSMVGNMDVAAASDETRVRLGAEAYRCAEAFVTAKDTYIRQLPTPELDPVGY